MDDGTYNVRKATCGQFCHGCLGAARYSTSISAFSVAAGGQQQLYFYSDYNNGQQYNETSGSAWSTANGGIATVGRAIGLITPWVIRAIGQLTLQEHSQRMTRLLRVLPELAAGSRSLKRSL
jgi:hypothetical protein